ncbi:MAG: ATP-binding protein, partial [Gemmatimonadota bacterium]|nr:ATP-binding protein [Gemmatimonadota bacterium]
VVALAKDGVLRGVIGMGWDPVAVRALSLPVEVAGTVRDDDDTLPGLTRYVVLPIPGLAAERGVFGALLVDPGERDRSELGDVEEILRHAGPPLARLAELDELRQSSSQLDQQRQLLTAILDALPDPVLITDSQNNILLENRRAEALLTTREGDSQGRRRAVEINNLLLSSFLTRAVIAGADPASRELNLVDPTEGGDLLFEVLTTALPAELGEEGSVVSVLRDVTDLKRASTELEHQFKRVRQAEGKASRERDRLNLILENVGDPILVTDEESNIILMNRKAERLFDLPGTDLSSRRRREVRANDTKFSSLVSDFALSPDDTRVEEFQLIDPESHDEFPVEIVSGKILNERAEMTAIVSIIHDLTKVVENERLAAELTRLNEGLEDRVRSATEELEERNRQLEWQSRELERAYRLKSEFLASMSHELRTPINALLGYTSLMRDRIYGDVTARQEEALDRMYAASGHLLELVNDILDLAKIEAGKMPVHLERVEMESVIRELSETVEPMVRKKQLSYRVEVTPEIPALETDRTKVKQIILNLLSNAVKFTHEGEVALVARPVGDGVELAVSDTGIGIAPENLDHIFEDFRQVDQSSTREYGGTGLGLSITKKLLHLLGGTIRVESCPGEGSTFTVWLPLRSREVRVDEEAALLARHGDEAVVKGDHC